MENYYISSLAHNFCLEVYNKRMETPPPPLELRARLQAVGKISVMQAPATIKWALGLRFLSPG